MELKQLLKSSRWKKGRSRAEEVVDMPLEENSPFPEVRVAVPNVDNPDLPQSTLRLWVLGVLFLTAATIVNSLFMLHNPPFFLSTTLCALAAWPLGHLWDRFVPNTTILGVPLNPGPFNIKEHTLLTIMISSITTTYSVEISLAVKLFYKWPGYGLGFETLLALSTQCIGLSMAGIFRRILIYPAAMIWPENLVSVTFLNNLHRKWNHVADGWTISRFQLFVIASVVCTIWSFVPSLFATFLSNFDFPAWIAPNNPVVNVLFGTQTGLGVFPVSFDWNTLSGWLGSPLVPPTRVFINTAACLFVFVWIAAAVIHFSNVWYGHYLPLVGSDTYDRFGNLYNAARVMTAEHTFDLDKYKQYSPLYMTTTTAVNYGLMFAATTSTLTHSALFDCRRYVRYWRHSRENQQDVHMRLMRRNYKEVPIWWFVVLFVVCFAMMVGAVQGYQDTGGTGIMVFAIVLAMLYIVPVGFIHAASTITIGLSVISELIGGYLTPGNPLAVMLFKTYTYYVIVLAINCLVNMKLGHYMKLSPRAVFAVQLVGVAWGGFLQIMVMHKVPEYIPDVCSPTQKLGYTCPTTQVFYNASIIWGVIGPQRIFELYRPLLHFLWIGALMPIISWLWLSRHPKSMLRLLHWPVFFNAVGYMPPATPYVYGCWIVVGLVFSYWIRRYWPNWWAKYNYTLSSGLDMGIAATQVVLLILSVTMNSSISWWGTVGWLNTRDGKGMPLNQLRPGEWFGPSKWG